ncbi:transposase [Streptomyces sp. NPDC048590]|uniref:transposase n=1 Tax=Streptomyces sp. NPDC048590 TaxID=3365574 RepID=UPI003719E621
MASGAPPPSTSKPSGGARSKSRGPPEPSRSDSTKLGAALFRSEAAFASFAGVSPIPASSGLTNWHRLNRSEDR